MMARLRTTSALLMPYRILLVIELSCDTSSVPNKQTNKSFFDWDANQQSEFNPKCFFYSAHQLRISSTASKTIEIYGCGSLQSHKLKPHPHSHLSPLFRRAVGKSLYSTGNSQHKKKIRYVDWGAFQKT
jgi:hypothetical protein